jgi:hypothetical protein
MNPTVTMKPGPRKLRSVLKGNLLLAAAIVVVPGSDKELHSEQVKTLVDDPAVQAVLPETGSANKQLRGSGYHPLCMVIQKILIFAV